MSIITKLKLPLMINVHHMRGGNICNFKIQLKV
jgi:hypothetical protein